MLTLFLVPALVLQVQGSLQQDFFINPKFYAKLGPYYKKRWPNAVSDPFEAIELILDSRSIESTGEYKPGVREKIFKEILTRALAGDKKAIYYMFYYVSRMAPMRGEEAMELRVHWGKMAYEQGDTLVRWKYAGEILYRSPDESKYKEERKKLAPKIAELAKQGNVECIAIFSSDERYTPPNNFNLNIKQRFEWSEKLQAINTPEANEALARIFRDTSSFVPDEVTLGFLKHAAKGGEWRAMTSLASYYGKRKGDWEKGWYWLDRAREATGLDGVVGNFFGDSDPEPRPKNKRKDSKQLLRGSTTQSAKDSAIQNLRDWIASSRQRLERYLRRDTVQVVYYCQSQLDSGQNPSTRLNESQYIFDLLRIGECDVDADGVNRYTPHDTAINAPNAVRQ